MPNLLPVTIDFGTIPLTGQGYNPQQFANRLGLNGRIFTEQSFALFTTGATAPTSDTGPWAKDGNSWYYWDSGTGSYVPFIVPPESLRYSVSATEPDPAIYLFWIKLDGLGSPLGVFTYYSGAWVDVYSAAGYLTIAAFNAAIANYSTTAQMNTAIGVSLAAANAYTDAAVAGIPAQNQYPAVSTASGQSDAPNGSDYPIAGLSYVAPVTGKYLVSVQAQMDGAGVSASTMQVLIFVTVNGVSSGAGGGDATPSPVGTRWFPSTTTLVDATAGDTIGASYQPQDGVGAGTLTVSNTLMSVNYVPG